MKSKLVYIPLMALVLTCGCADNNADGDDNYIPPEVVQQTPEYMTLQAEVDELRTRLSDALRENQSLKTRLEILQTHAQETLYDNEDGSDDDNTRADSLANFSY